MKTSCIVRNVGIPPARVTVSTLYDFAAMTVGDAIDVSNMYGAKQSFYRWRSKSDRRDVVLRYVGASPDDATKHRFIMVPSAQD